MAHVTLPNQNQVGVNEWSDVESNDQALADEINGNLDNDNIKSSAAIAHSKLANTSAGRLLIANASGVITGTAMSGDVTITDAGVTTIGSSKVTTGKINDDAVTPAKLDLTTYLATATPGTIQNSATVLTGLSQAVAAGTWLVMGGVRLITTATTDASATLVLRAGGLAVQTETANFGDAFSTDVDITMWVPFFFVATVSATTFDITGDDVNNAGNMNYSGRLLLVRIG